MTAPSSCSENMCVYVGAGTGPRMRENVPVWWASQKLREPLKKGRTRGTETDISIHLLWEHQDVGERVAVHQHAQEKHRAEKLAECCRLCSLTLLSRSAACTARRGCCHERLAIVPRTFYCCCLQRPWVLAQERTAVTFISPTAALDSKPPCFWHMAETGTRRADHASPTRTSKFLLKSALICVISARGCCCLCCSLGSSSSSATTSSCCVLPPSPWRPKVSSIGRAG